MHDRERQAGECYEQWLDGCGRPFSSTVDMASTDTGLCIPQPIYLCDVMRVWGEHEQRKLDCLFRVVLSRIPLNRTMIPALSEHCSCVYRWGQASFCSGELDFIQWLFCTTVVRATATFLSSPL